MKDNLVKNILDPEILVEGDGFSLLLKGITYDNSQWVTVPFSNFQKKYGQIPIDEEGEKDQYLKMKSEEELESINEAYGFAEREVLQRAIRACVKKVSGIGVIMKEGEAPIDLPLEFENDILSKKSYEVLMRAISNDEAFVQNLYQKYTELVDFSKYVVIKKKS